MPQLISTGDQFIELKDDGTFTRHKVIFIQQRGYILRIDFDAQGKETPSFIAPKVLMIVDAATGDIIQEQRGFVIDHEILGIPTHPDADKDYVGVLESDIPADYATEDPVTKAKTINYRYNKTTGKLARKP